MLPSYISYNFFEWHIDIAIVTEPNFINSEWFADTSNKVAVVMSNSSRSFCRLCEAGNGFLAAAFHDIVFIAAYLSPNLKTLEYKERIEALAKIMSKYKCKDFILLGDFNANLVIWGSNFTNARGKYLFELTSSFGLGLANDKGDYTCLKAQGSSVIDLVWYSSSLAARISNCRVLDGSKCESFSDLCYIRFEILVDKAAPVDVMSFKR